MTTTDARRNGQRTTADLPANVEAEEAVLGCCLRGREALAWATEHLEADHFHRPAHRAVFAILAELHTDRQPVDPKAAAAALSERGALADVGGAPFLARLFDEAPTPANVGWYGRKVRATAQLRRLIDAGTRITEVGFDEADPDRALDIARAMLAELVPADDLRLAGPRDILHAMLEVREQEEHGSRVTWGLKGLDNLTNGLPPRQLIVVGAAPSQGKSSLALQVALAAARGRRALFGSWEMGLSEIGQHHLAALGGVSLDEALYDVATDRLSAARADYQGRSFYVLDGRPTLERFCAQVTRLHDREPLDLVVVDYLQLVQTMAHYERRDLQVGGISAALKQLAVECNLPVLVISTMTKADDGKPTMKGLRDSGMISYDADIVVLLAERVPEDGPERLQQEAEQWRVVDAIVDKNRMGKTGRVPLRFDEPRTVFSDLRPQQLPDPTS